MKVKVGSVILGFVMICIGIAALAGQTPVFGIHPIVWFILGVMLICSDSAWEKLAHAKRHEHGGKDEAAGGAPNDGADAGNMPDPEADSGKVAARGYDAANSARTDAPANDTRK